MKMRAVVGFAAFLAVAALGLAAAANGTTAGQDAQQNQAPPPPGPRPGPPGMRGPGGHGGPGDIGRMIFDLDLTAEQVQKVKALTKAERDTASSYMEEGRQIEEQLRAETEKDTFNEEAVTALVRQQADLMVKMRVISARTQFDIYKLLTAEQKTALAAARAQQPPPPPRRGR